VLTALEVPPPDPSSRLSLPPLPHPPIRPLVHPPSCPALRPLHVPQILQHLSIRAVSKFLVARINTSFVLFLVEHVTFRHVTPYSYITTLIPMCGCVYVIGVKVVRGEAGGARGGGGRQLLLSDTYG